MTDIAYADYSPPSLFELIRARRGWSDEFLKELNDIPTQRLKRLDEMVDALRDIFVAQKKIVIMPDFDTDGVTAGTLGYAGFAQLGFNVGMYVPDYRHGHDIRPEAIDELLTQHPDVSVIITCDAGINSHAGVAHAQSRGVSVFVTDHHVENAPGCNADLYINPASMDEDYPNPHICGAAVMYTLVHRYCEIYAPQHMSLITHLRLFAGIGTVSDVMPLIGISRAWARDAVSISRLLYPQDSSDSTIFHDVLSTSTVEIHPVFRTVFDGYVDLLRTLKANGKLGSIDYLDVSFFAFYIAPMINSLRRVSASHFLAFDALNHPESAQRKQAAQELFNANELRKEAVKNYIDELVDVDQPFAPFAYFTEAPPGMLGLIASNISSRTEAPVYIVKQHEDGSISGSARAPEWFDIVSQLTSNGFSAVGHEQACGVSAENIAEFSDLVALTAQKSEEIQALAALQPQHPRFGADLLLGSFPECDTPLSDTDEILDCINRLGYYGPFGEGFREPKIAIKVNLSECSIMPLGKNKRHIKIITEENFTLLWWNSAGDHLDELKALQDMKTTAVFITTLSINSFRGKVSPQAIVDDLILEGE